MREEGFLNRERKHEKDVSKQQQMINFK